MPVPAYPKDIDILKKIDNYLRGVMPEKEWEGFAEREKQQVKDFGRAILKGITHPLGLTGNILSQPKEERAEEIRRSLSGVTYPLKQLSRPVEGVRAGISASIDGKNPKEISQKIVKGFLIPENVKPVLRKIPFTDFESKGSWMRLIPRALAEATETMLLYSTVYGTGKKDKFSRVEKKEMLKNHLVKNAKERGISKEIIKKTLKNKKFKESLDTIVNLKNKEGFSFSEYVDTLTKVYTAPIKTGSMVDLAGKSYKVVSVSGQVAKLIGAGGKSITAKLSDLKPVSKTQPTEAKADLIEQAKKYKTPEEFVESQGEVLYHGTISGNKFDVFDKNKANIGVGGDSLNQGKDVVYLSKDKRGAEILSQVSNERIGGEGTGEILDFNIDSSAKIKKWIGKDTPTKQDIEQLKKQGYDGVEFDDIKNYEGIAEGRESLWHKGDTNTVAIWNTDKLQTKQQLTDIWKKAQETPKLLTSKEGGRFRTPKTISLPRGDNFILQGLPRKKGLSAPKILAKEQKKLQEERLGFILKGKPKDVKTKTSTDKLKAIKRFFAVATEKALISSKGKPKPQLRLLAQSMVGKRKISSMTPDEINELSNAILKLSEPTQAKGGVIKPPRIPTTTRVVPEGFFQRKFKTPTPSKFLTSQTRYADLLGVKDLTKPFEKAKGEMDLEYGKMSVEIDKAIKQVKKTKGITTENIAKALNTSEEAPVSFNPEQKKLFNYFRNLSRGLIERENEVLISLGFEPIKYRQAYFRHIADQMVMDILRGEHPLPEGLKYWSEKVVSKKVYNPMEMKRKLTDDLLEYFSKDLEYVSKAMTYKALETIHMSTPKRFFNEKLNALSKDKSIYKNLTPEQEKLYAEQQVLPASTKKWLLDYINIQLGNRQTALDDSVNRFVTDSILKDIFNKVLKPFGKAISQRPLTKMIQKVSRLPIYGAMGGLNPRQIIRNKFQRVQDIALYGTKNTTRGYLPTGSEPTLEKLKTDSLFKRSYSGFEELPAQLRGKIEKIGLAPYQWSAQSNVSQSMNTAYYWVKNKIVNPKCKDLGWASPKRTYKEPKGFFYPEELEQILKEMEYGAHTTQYQYIGMGMPEIFRHKSLSGLTRLQSWWMNHWFVFHREAVTRAFTGHTGYNENLKLSAGDRFNYIKYLILGGLILSNLGYYRSYLFGTAPSALAPTAQLSMALYQWFISQGNSNWAKRKRSQAEYHIKEALKIHIPAYLTIKDLNALIKGDKDWKEYLFYIKEEKKKKQY